MSEQTNASRTYLFCKFYSTISFILSILLSEFNSRKYNPEERFPFSIVDGNEFTFEKFFTIFPVTSKILIEPFLISEETVVDELNGLGKTEISAVLFSSDIPVAELHPIENGFTFMETAVAEETLSVAVTRI